MHIISTSSIEFYEAQPIMRVIIIKTNNDVAYFITPYRTERMHEDNTDRLNRSVNVLTLSISNSAILT